MLDGQENLAYDGASYEAGPKFARATGDDAAEKIFDFIRDVHGVDKPKMA